MKVLIFYSRTGSGHLRAAHAIEVAIHALHPHYDVVLADGLEQKTLGISFSPAKAFSLLSGKLLFFYNISYILTNNSLGIIFFRWFIRTVFGENFKKIITKENPDLIISTHHFISPKTIPMKHLPPFSVIVSDLGTPHRIWFDTKAWIVVPTMDMKAYADTFVSRPDHIVPLGFPLPLDATPNTKHETTNRILILGGGTGSGNLQAQVKALLQDTTDMTVTVVCGKNEGLKKRLEKLTDPRLIVHWYVEHMHDVFLSVDIVITKAGPTTIVEAVMYKKPLIITGWVGMQEKGNVDFVVDHHLGLFIPETKDLAKGIQKIYIHYADYISEKSLFENKTKDIATFMLSRTND